MIFELISKEDKIGLCINRTNWKFGEANIYTLAIGMDFWSFCNRYSWLLDLKSKATAQIKIR